MSPYRFERVRQHTAPNPYLVGEAHFYSAELNGELVLFDTGPPSEAGVALLREQVDLKRLKHVFFTHCHVDHAGLARFLERECDPRFYLPARDAAKMLGHERRLAGVRGLLGEAGFDRSFCRSLLELLTSQRVLLTEPPRRFEIAEESDIPRQLGIEILPCPGHSQSDLVYLFHDRAVTGDVLLDGIFQAPLLDLDLACFEGRFDNYRAYCATLLKLPRLKGRTILPGHRSVLADPEPTVVSYVAKLLERAAEVKRYAELGTVAEVVDRIFGATLANPFVTYLKASEVVFMRDFLAEPQPLRASLQAIGLYPRVAPLFDSVAG